MFGKPLFCKLSSAAELWLGTCPLVSAWGVELHLLFDCQQQGVKSCFLSDAEGFCFSSKIPVLCCCMISESFDFRCDKRTTDLTLKTASRNIFVLSSCTEVPKNQILLVSTIHVLRDCVIWHQSRYLKVSTI